MDETSSGDPGHAGSDAEQQQQHGDQHEAGHAGHSGEGAASALAHLKSQVKQHRPAAGGDRAGGAPAGGHAQ